MGWDLDNVLPVFADDDIAAGKGAGNTQDAIRLYPGGEN